MTAPLTDRQEELLRWVQDFIETNSYAPTREEIAKAFAISLGAVQQCLMLIAAKGAIRIVPNVHRGIVLPKRSVRSPTYILGVRVA